ncbi:MAG: hypothetical protein J6O61_00980 [Butyrivibrio sp.]|uniref:hypothetical protein n=1 Tax=Butyrivibrio sp. TaxID=28121 RepID=UPI001AFE6B88|nr:hypothetical protein [Butyrivibrio sp.]MBO6239435.1 hypothetical protein [Butyrivibrio sp.]
MRKYKLFGLVIESDIDFLQLMLADQNDSNDVVTVHAGKISEIVDKELEGESVNYKVGLEFSCFRNSYGYYVINGGNEIIYESKEGVDLEAIKAFILGYCIAMLLLHKRTLSIHCSAVCDDNSDNDGAILITGESGAGKSSLTRKLIECGYKVMSDDIAAIKKVTLDGEEKCLVYPAFPYQKLCRNEVEKRSFDSDEIIYINEDKDKFLVPLKDTFIKEPRKLKGMIFLTVCDEKEINVQRLSGIMQLMALKQNLFLRKFYGDWQKDPEILQLCLQISEKCPVYLIKRPKEGDTLSEIAEKVKTLF